MTKENPKISAIIKTFNSENTLCEVIEAIKESTEIIIVDNHSTDDTIEIAKEYKTKIIYADRVELSKGIKNAIDEASCDWILILDDDEIIPQKLLFELEKYIENPKKNKFALTLSKKTFYLDKEIKAARIKKELCFFKKGSITINDDYKASLKVTSGKIYNFNKNFKIKNAYKLKYSKIDISKRMNNLIQENKFLLKTIKSKKASILIRPLFTFLYWYIIKKAFLDGRFGLIFAKEKAIKEFILQIMILEKLRSNYDIW